MNTERAIGIIERVFTVDLAGTFALDQKQCLINLLKRGEKFEAMWGEFKRIEGCNIAMYPVLKDKHKPKIEEDMNNIEQKYFPETIKKTITIEIEGEDDIELQLATVVMKKALDDWDFKKDIVKNFKVIGD